MRIGLIAMSGLRICKPELLELRFTFPRVQERAREIEALPSLGLLTLAGMTPADVEVEYLEVRDVDQWSLPTRFDAVAMSTLTAVSCEAFRLAARFRAMGVPVILGGLGVTLSPTEAMKHADAVVLGEGEVVWPDVVRDLRRGALQPVYDARARGPFDMSQAPMPRFDLLSPERYPRFSVQTQRGCPWACEFCASSIRLEPRFRVKPVEHVIAEIRRLKELFGSPFIEFADDNTFVNRVRAKELLRALEKESVRWFTESDLSIAWDDDLLSLMRDAGCAQVIIGFEHPKYAALDGVEQKVNWKARMVGRYEEAVRRIQRHGITVNGCFVLGLDGTGTESAEDILRFVRESGMYDVQVTYLTPFPGTPLWDRMAREGRILDESATERCTLFDVNFRPDRMTVAELEEAFLGLVGRLYEETAVQERSRAFREHLRSARRRPAAA
ncbi:MAG: B12-binding domain-containing radical SAM protein [Gemmatimonadetes bacterium]|nr:B12-binding domain-containing radical SAM protein [Gemmatimonadota bacterium]